MAGAAEAQVDFIGKDAGLQAQLDKVEKSTNKLGKVFKSGISLFSAEKVMSWGKAVFNAAGQTEEFKGRFDRINEVVGDLQVSLAGPLYAAIEGLLPGIEAITEAMTGWEIGEDITYRIERAQVRMARLAARLTPGVTADEAEEEILRQREDDERRYEKMRADRKAAREGGTAVGTGKAASEVAATTAKATVTATTQAVATAVAAATPTAPARFRNPGARTEELDPITAKIFGAGMGNGMPSLGGRDGLDAAKNTAKNTADITQNTKDAADATKELLRAMKRGVPAVGQ
jgi:hypothetical protein